MPVIALDLGATKLAAALISDQGDVIFKTNTPLEKRQGTEVGKLILQQVNELSGKAKENDLIVAALGICVPGIAYTKTGNVWAPNIPGWDDYPLLNELQRAINNTGIKIRIDSDRACYILGEVWKGNARGCSEAIFLAVGSGIGAGILVNNKVLRGSHDIGGAIGWMGLKRPYQEKYINCGDFEYNASGEGIVKVAKEMISSGYYKDSKLAQIKFERLSAKDVFDALESGDELSKQIIDNAIECWGIAVANLVSLFNPEKIIIGGGVFGPALKFLDAIYEEAGKWAQPISFRHVKLEGSALGKDAGLYGAGYLALKD